ncbi:CsgE family curli-type amyloid fiber assembly protein [Sedimenticola sp.]|uniref:CsgE family curli-type amyloid fiber assembly protein n=1 Tax=Sedimenticola sp. TaxID=1940285 RepID=UPI003D11DE9D
MRAARLSMHCRFFVLATLALAGWHCAAAQQLEGGESFDSQVIDDGVQGVVIDRTITFIGRSFFSYFSGEWINHPAQGKFSLSIHERPSARTGSIIWIENERNVVYRGVFSPARSAIESTAKGVAQMLAGRLEEEMLRRQLIVNPDLAEDEW